MSLEPEWPFLGRFEVWAVRGLAVTLMDRVVRGKGLGAVLGRRRCSLLVGAAPESGIFSSATQGVGGVPRARMAFLGVF